MQGLALPSGLSSCFSTSAEGICRAPTPKSTRLGPAVRGLRCISNSNPSLNSPCSSLPQLGMCRGSTEAWLVALILSAESLSVSPLLFHFPFLPLRPWGCRAGQELLCQPQGSVESWGCFSSRAVSCRPPGNRLDQNKFPVWEPVDKRRTFQSHFIIWLKGSAVPQVWFALLADLPACWHWLALHFSPFCQINSCRTLGMVRLALCHSPLTTAEAAGVELLVPELLHAVSITPLNTQECSQRSWLEGTGNSLVGTGSFLKAWQSPRGRHLGFEFPERGAGPAPAPCEFVSGRDGRRWGQTNGSSTGNVSGNVSGSLPALPAAPEGIPGGSSRAGLPGRGCE